MTKETFSEAVEYFLTTVAQVPDGRWEDDALGEWNVRDLVGHISRAMLLVEEYATTKTSRSGFGTAADIAERGREAGRALGDDPQATLRTIADRVTVVVDRLPDDHPMETPAGQRPLSRYLPTRVTELTVHTMDLARALGIEAEPPTECLRETLHSLSDYAVRLGVAGELAFALTGRAPLRPDFTVVT